MSETTIINGQPQSLGNKMVTYDGLVDFFKMLKDEIPRMGVDNSIAIPNANNYLFGFQNQSCGYTQFAVGKNNYLGQLDDAFAFGENNDITGGEVCFAFGNDNNAESVSRAYGFGNHLNLTSNAVWIGQYNINHENLGNSVVFGIGNGKDEEGRHNSLIVTKDNTLVLNPFTDSYSSDADNIKNNVFINSYGRSNQNILKGNITNSMLIGQLAAGTIGNIEQTIVVGKCSQAEGLKHSLLLGDYHRMNLQSSYGEDLDNSFKAFQVFAFGSRLQVPNTTSKAFYAQQADYPIFLMGTGIYDRNGSDQEDWTPYAMVVGNKALEKNVFTLDYQGYINAAGISVESMFIDGVYVDASTLTGAADLIHRLDPVAPTNSTSEYDSKYAYWYTADFNDSTLYINKYTGAKYISSAAHPAWHSPKTIAFYTNNQNDADEKATLQAKNFIADTIVSAPTVSATTLDAVTVKASNLQGTLQTASFLSGLIHTQNESYCQLPRDHAKRLYYCMIKVNNTTLDYQYYTCLFYLDTVGQTQYSQILHTWNITGITTITLVWDIDNHLRLKTSNSDSGSCQFVLLKELAHIKED